MKPHKLHLLTFVLVLFFNQVARAQDSLLNPNKLSRQQLEAGLEKMKEMYPDDAAKIDQYKQTVLNHIVDGADIPVNHPIRNEKNLWQNSQVTESNARISITITPCQKQAATFVVEAGTFVVTVAGMYTASTKWFDRYIQSAFFQTDKYVTEFTPLLKVFNEASGNVAKAKALAPIAKKLWDMGALKGMFDIVKANSSYFDWIVSGGIMVAQIVVWIGSEFIAAVAQLAVTVLSAVQLIKSGEDTYHVCK